MLLPAETKIFNRAYSSAAEDDLYNSFQEAVDIANITLPFKVSNIMMTWSLQSGYPVVTVHRNTDGSILLTQVSIKIELKIKDNQKNKKKQTNKVRKLNDWI